MTLYRAIVKNLGDDEDLLLCNLYLDIEQYNIIRESEFFYIIRVKGKERRVGKNSKSQFAATTQEKALSDAYLRNRRYKSILNAYVQENRQGHFRCVKSPTPHIVHFFEVNARWHCLTCLLLPTLKSSINFSTFTNSFLKNFYEALTLTVHFKMLKKIGSSTLTKFISV